MPTVKRLEQSILKVEGFTVRIRHPGGRDVRGDKAGLPSWPYVRRAKDKFSVARWRDVRFVRACPGYAVDVLRRDRSAAHGRTLLSTVRATYP